MSTPEDPYALFQSWLDAASADEPNDPNAMTLATCDGAGMPSARMVLLKGIDARGFVFYTNTESHKGRDLAQNPRAALLFHWKSLHRQVRIDGAVEPVSAAEADAYYATRPRLSRLGAWASAQSRPLASRAELEANLAAMQARYPDEAIPRPPHWSGYRVLPARFEFWQDMPFRLHDRMVYTPAPGGWAMQRLFP
jgi:pyridoxamine 5'-phosphate oxidase